MFPWDHMSDTSIVHIFVIIVIKKFSNLCVVECYYKLWWNKNFRFIFHFQLSFLTLSFIFLQNWSQFIFIH